MTYKQLLEYCKNENLPLPDWKTDIGEAIEKKKASFLTFVFHNARHAYKMMKSAREPNEKRTPFLQHFFDSKTDEEIFFGYFGKRLLEIIDNYSVENGRYSSNVFTKEELVDILLEEYPFLYGMFYSFGRTYSDIQMEATVKEKEKISKEKDELLNKIDVLVNLHLCEDDKLLPIINRVPEAKCIIEEIISLKNRIGILEAAKSNLLAFPYMSQIMADYETYGLEMLAKSLDWGHSAERQKKIKSIREIRKDAMDIVEKNKVSQYQLAYLLELYPALKDVIECDYSQLPIVEIDALSEYDHTRDYLTKDEYEDLSVSEKNQLALDRYVQSHTKTKWQIGRDYENYIGYKCMENGCTVEYPGSYFKLEDLGRDVIAKKDNQIFILQCKYWSSIKEIHEKHIMQLYGTIVSYCIENNCDVNSTKGVIVTNIQLSDTAKKIAEYLGIEYKEHVQMGDYPRIKCNIGHREEGETKIYHLPFDQQYDATKIDKKGEFMATTVAEAEAAGFRRASKWFGD